MRSEAEWIGEYEKAKSLLVYDKVRPTEPHAILTSGLHSDVYFDSRPIIFNTALITEAVNQLMDMLIADPEFDLDLPTVAVGPQSGGTLIAQLTATAIMRLRRAQKPNLLKHCRWASPKKEFGKMRFVEHYGRVFSGDVVLRVDDVISTGISLTLATRECLRIGAEVLPFALTLVNRSKHPPLSEGRVISLITCPMTEWPALKCPLCPTSPAIRPKEDSGNLSEVH